MRWTALGAAVCATLVLASATGSAAETKRKLPDYDNRGKAPTTFGDVAIWVPRVILSPVYLVTEYGIRWPLGHLIAAAERADLPDILYNFFFFGPDHKAGAAPVAFVDFGFRPSVGLYAFWDDAFADGNDLRFHGTTGGANWFAGVLSDRIRFHHEGSLTFTFTGIRRPDQAFFGTGPDTRQDDISRFGEALLETDALADFRLWRASRIETSLGLRSLDFHRGHFDEDPSVEQAVARGSYALPDGFTQGYTAQTSSVHVALDNRLPSPADGSGFRFEVQAEQGTDIRRAPGASWLKYGATVGGFLDLNGRNRVISLSLATMFADPLDHRPIPFTELVTLGGPGPMRGFYPGRLRDRSAAVLTAKYRWPIWVWLDGSLQAAVGNVFGEHLQQLDTSRFRFSGAVGFESVGSRDGSFELLVGMGTETFDHGAQIDSARVLVGTNRGF
ncbi:MAG TPA: BamA/TamA family outer membrane protein [Polyangiaceae bacterium]|jgi:hypothetical protein|nr:BamA/TamA family outer membrane protein [Polyangiaceae bacterium]